MNAKIELSQTKNFEYNDFYKIKKILKIRNIFLKCLAKVQFLMLGHFVHSGNCEASAKPFFRRDPSERCNSYITKYLQLKFIFILIYVWMNDVNFKAIYF